MISQEKYDEVMKENKKLEKKFKEKQRQFNALVEHLKLKYDYSDYRIFNIIEKYVKRSE